jgi:hypothetical protein
VKALLNPRAQQMNENLGSRPAAQAQRHSFLNQPKCMFRRCSLLSVYIHATTPVLFSV